MQRVPGLVLAIAFGIASIGFPVEVLADKNHGHGDSGDRDDDRDRDRDRDRAHHEDDDDDGGNPHDGDCRGLHGAEFGLCVAYCEAKECDEHEGPSCDRLREKLEERTGSSVFPCDPPEPPERPCAELDGAARGICFAFCEALECDVSDRRACDILRRVFFRLTGSSAFPCEGVTPTPTMTPTDTAPPTATDTPTETATETPVAATDTPTATPTDTAVPATATDTPTGTPTGTAAATVTPTDTPADTPTETPVAATDTPTETPTETPVAATDTPTATPTDTAVPATATDTATGTPTPTDTATAAPTPTDTPMPVVCPLEGGTYTLTQVSGGSLRVDGLPPFPFPAGGTIVQDVSAGDADCVHDVAVPFPGGFNAPVFCIPSLGFTTSVVQTGCGIGLIDSNGGSDFTITEVGDTSSPVICNLPHAGCSNGSDSSAQVDVTVGDATPDVCGSGTANATVSIPVFTTTWLTFAGCPDPDGMYNPGADTLIVSFPQTLDFTTDSTSGDWTDLDPDDCCIAGAGPGSNTNPCNPGGAGGLTSTGTCIDLTGLDVAGADVTTVAAGAVGSSGSPLYDLTFVTTLPNEISSGGTGGTCATPPAINYGGTATRCIQ